MRYLSFIIILLPIVCLSQTVDSYSCPDCDLSLQGFAFEVFGGIGPFSVDADSPMVTEKMGIDELPPWGIRGGGGFQFYPGGRYRLSLYGGYNWTRISEDQNKLNASAYWGAFTPELVRTAGYIRLGAGLGIGGGMVSVKAVECSIEKTENTPMFVLYPKASIEFPLSDFLTLSLDMSYLWFTGEDKTMRWNGPSIGEEVVLRELRYSPVEFGGPSISIALSIGKVIELRDRPK